jgi:hypothetical protein
MQHRSLPDHLPLFYFFCKQKSIKREQKNNRKNKYKIYTPISTDARNAMKAATSPIIKDTQADISLILLRAFETYPLIWNALQLWQWSVIKLAPQNGHLFSLFMIFINTQCSSNHLSITVLGKHYQ